VTGRTIYLTAALAGDPSLRSRNLTASGLGFLAGCASHSFFGFLDNLIRTAFPLVPTPHPVVTSRPALSIGPVGMPYLDPADDPRNSQ
jgi:hypothetical protein